MINFWTKMYILIYNSYKYSDHELEHEGRNFPLLTYLTFWHVAMVLEAAWPCGVKTTSSKCIPLHGKLLLHSNFIATSEALVPLMFWYTMLLTCTAETWNFTKMVVIVKSYSILMQCKQFLSLLIQNSPSLCMASPGHSSFDLQLWDLSHFSLLYSQILCFLHTQNLPVLW